MFFLLSNMMQIDIFSNCFLMETKFGETKNIDYIYVYTHTGMLIKMLRSPSMERLMKNIDKIWM